MTFKQIPRTVQFWRIVNAIDETPLANDTDWNAVFNDITSNKPSSPFSHSVNGRQFSGQIVNVGSAARHQLHQKLPGHTHPKYGLIISGLKDYVPNQQDKTSGHQLPVGLNEGWDAVDNTFILHLPFGNIFALLLESQSSGRANSYASWLTHLLREKKIIDKEKSLSAIPVIDSDAVARAKKAHGVKALTLRAPLGKSSPSRNMLNRLFDSSYDFHDVDVEIKISTRRGRSKPQDEQEVLNMFKKHLGDLPHYSKAVVKAIDNNGEINEINLLKERLTRKQNITLDTSRAIVDSVNKDVVFPALAEAFIKDYKDLQKLKDDGR